MAVLSTPSGAFPIALVYITVGAVIDVWTILALWIYPPETRWGYFLILGSMITGFALLVIGILLGQIGRAARNAELPPAEVTPSVTQVEQTAAANPPPVVPAATAQTTVPTAPIPTAVSANATPPTRVMDQAVQER